MQTETRRSRKLVVPWLLVAAAVAALLLGVSWTTVLLVGIVLCCPLMMLFMDHGGHTGGPGREAP